MEGQGQCRVVQYRVERKEKKDRGEERREEMETEEGRNFGDEKQW